MALATLSQNQTSSVAHSTKVNIQLSLRSLTVELEWQLDSFQLEHVSIDFDCHVYGFLRPSVDQNSKWSDFNEPVCIWAEFFLKLILIEHPCLITVKIWLASHLFWNKLASEILNEPESRYFPLYLGCIFHIFMIVSTSICLSFVSKKIHTLLFSIFWEL